MKQKKKSYRNMKNLNKILDSYVKRQWTKNDQQLYNPNIWTGCYILRLKLNEIKKKKS